MGVHVVRESWHVHVTRESWHVDVRDSRKNAGITQKEMAVRTGIRQARISEIENGQVDPKLSEVIAISDVLELAMAAFPREFSESMEQTFRDCERLKMHNEGTAPTIMELILGDVFEV